MRFYQRNWAQRIVEELDKDSNRLLCCQNIALEKKEDGRIKNNGEMGTFGALLRFNNDGYIPQIKWNGEKRISGLKGNQIPAVLGACYCASKEYWNKLKGFQGLIHMGVKKHTSV